MCLITRTFTRKDVIDASRQYDEAEFSDDEKEAEYQRLRKQNKRGRNNQNTDQEDGKQQKASSSKRWFHPYNVCLLHLVDSVDRSTIEKCPCTPALAV
ncbi:hypothetical protein MtrunA17_Chr7g0275261 [Medicago truncatula]|nr:hypothetical protein MtrunA17_Chr7g0275261 [Medicago truncatula]